MPLGRLGSNHCGAPASWRCYAVFSARMNSRSGTKRISYAVFCLKKKIRAAQADGPLSPRVGASNPRIQRTQEQEGETGLRQRSKYLQGWCRTKGAVHVSGDAVCEIQRIGAAGHAANTEVHGPRGGPVGDQSR